MYFKGGSAYRGRGGEGRGRGRDDRRYNSAPPVRGGGFGRPPNRDYRGSQGEEPPRNDPPRLVLMVGSLLAKDHGILKKKWWEK